MTRNLKSLGVAMAAVIVMSAIASSASAETTEHKFTAASYPVSVHAGQNTTHIFTTAAGREVTCKSVTFTGTLTGKSKSLTITPAYNECHTVLAGTTLSATVTVNGCTYKLTAPTTHKNTPSGTVTTPGEVHIECPVNQSITVDIYGGATHKEGDATFCKLHVGPQTKSGIEYTNSGGNVLLNVAVTGIIVSRTGNATCGALSTTAIYAGTSTATGNGGAVAIDVGL